jgi:hypothetical protein
MHQSLVLPYLRTSPVHLARRDIVLSVSESLTLNAAVVYEDTPDAPAIDLTTDADGPATQLVIWSDYAARPSGWWDYGYPYSQFQTVLQSVSGTPGDAVGSWDFYLPTGTFSQFPSRCGWAILLLWNAGAKSSVLAHGIMNFVPPFFSGVPLVGIPDVPPGVPPAASLLALTTDTGVPITTSDTLLPLETS